MRRAILPLALFTVVVALEVSGCRCRRSAPTPASGSASASGAADSAPSASADAGPPSTSVSVGNGTDKDAQVFVSFSVNSVVLPADWAEFCTKINALSCSFLLLPKAVKQLPVNGKYLNATFTFDAPVGCGTTKAEINVNNPQWYDIVDLSLVDGFSKFVMIDANGQKLFVRGKAGNEKAFGVYPYGCDICVSREAPPCGIPKGSEGCKTGTQYKPDVPCQYQGPKMGGGGKVEILLLQPVPA